MRLRGESRTERLLQQRDQLLAEAEAIRNKIAGLEMAIALINEESAVESKPRGSARKANVMATLSDLIRESGAHGLNAKIAVEMAERRGIELNRASISSLLSRLRRDGSVVYENSRYKLSEFARNTRSKAGKIATAA